MTASETSSEAKLDNDIDSLKDSIEKSLELYETKAAVVKMDFKEPPEVINMSMDVLRKKGPDELNEYVLQLNRYALYLQKLTNTEKSWEIWAVSQLNEVTGILLPEVGREFGWNERTTIAQARHPLCKKLNAFLRDIRMKISRLSYLPNEIHRIADSINDMKIMALRREKNG